jgi:hypothetical protein
MRLRRLRRDPAGDAFRPVLNPRAVGAGVWVILVAILIGLNFDPRVHATQERAFGARPLGLPLEVPMPIANLLLALPFFWVLRHVAILMQRARADRASVDRLGFMVYLLQVARLHPEHRRSQTIVAIGGLYAVILAAAWIAYTAYLGI